VAQNWGPVEGFWELGGKLLDFTSDAVSWLAGRQSVAPGATIVSRSSSPASTVDVCVYTCNQRLHSDTADMKYELGSAASGVFSLVAHNTLKS
jgi:hypothetical protein